MRLSPLVLASAALACSQTTPAPDYPATPPPTSVASPVADPSPSDSRWREACPGGCDVQGPFETLDAMVASDESFEDLEIWPELAERDSFAARIVARRSDGYAPGNQYGLAMRTADGWVFVDVPLGADFLSRESAAYLENAELYFVDALAGGAPELIVQVERGTAEGHGCCGMRGGSETVAFLCGFEPHGCWAQVRLGQGGYESEEGLLMTPQESRGDCEQWQEQPGECPEGEPFEPSVDLEIDEGVAVISNASSTLEERDVSAILCGLGMTHPNLDCARGS